MNLVLSKIDFVIKMKTRIVHKVDRRFESITLWYIINLILKLNSPTIFVFSAKLFKVQYKICICSKLNVHDVHLT